MATSEHQQILPPIQPADPMFRSLIQAQITQEQGKEPLGESGEDKASKLSSLPEYVPHAGNDSPKTVLYLAYGSNLAASTFRGRRKISPLSAVNVIVPSLKLTFDLPGVPYTEPCFANTHRRDPKHPVEDDPRWQHGLVGVVYEVTPEDFATIINTEGGGASYKDVQVQCWPLAKGLEDVPQKLPGSPFKAHTLLAPPESSRLRDPKYKGAEPSPRYKGLLTTGAKEHDLPASYQTYLNDLSTYQITSWRQILGKIVVVGTFAPFILLLLALSHIFKNDKGHIPKWLGDYMNWMFKAMWTFYGNIVKPACGNGEMTERKDKTTDNKLPEKKRRRSSILKKEKENDEEVPFLEKQ